jgi:hypothetical protein
MLASVLCSVVLSRAIDPVIDRWREKLRGRRLDTNRKQPGQQ